MIPEEINQPNKHVNRPFREKLDVDHQESTKDRSYDRMHEIYIIQHDREKMIECIKKCVNKTKIE